MDYIECVVLFDRQEYAVRGTCKQKRRHNVCGSEDPQRKNESVPSTKTKYSDFVTYPQMHSMFLKPTHPIDILEVVTKFKPKTSCDHDEIQ